MTRRFAAKMWSVLRNRKGFTLTEVATVLVIATIIGAGVYSAYGKVSGTNWAQATATNFGVVYGQLSQAKADKNGTFPAAASAAAITTAGTTTTSGAVTNYVGTATTSPDIQNWTYLCTAAGSTMVIAITDPSTPSAQAQGALVSKINSMFGGSVTAAITSATVVTVTTTGIAGSTCS